MSLIQKLNAAQKLIGAVEKNGYNGHFKFNYQAWDDVVPAVRDACAQVGIAIIPSIEDVQILPSHVVIKMQFVVTDGEDTITLTWWGEAKGNDDKNLQKAATSATKYAYLKLFLIPIAGEEDPDSGKGTVDPSEIDYTLKDNVSQEQLIQQSKRIYTDLFVGKVKDGDKWVPNDDRRKSLMALGKEKGLRSSELAYQAWLEGIRDYDGFYGFVSSYVKENK